MNAVLRFSVLLLALHLSVLSPEAMAADNAFPCLEGSIGRSLRWSAAWQNDRKDDGVSYQISDLLHVQSSSSYTVVLRLESESTAAASQRHLVVNSDAAAKNICERFLAGSTRTRTLPRPAPSPRPQEPEFIHYTQFGWVRGELPNAQTPLSSCRIGGREFLCRETERERFEAQLQLVAEQIDAQPRLGAR